jgi:hypothetical protein
VQVCKDFGIDTSREACTDSGCVVIKSAVSVTQDPVDGGIQDDTAYNVHIASSSTTGYGLVMACAHLCCGLCHHVY